MAGPAYLDWNATAPLRPQARAAMAAALEAAGNPSSVHAAGRAARRLLDEARERVAALVGASAKDVVFTSGGTEANALALSPSIGGSLLASTIEHPSVRSGGRFTSVEDVPVTAEGVVDLAALERLVAGRDRPLVSIMLANNETGVIQPVAKVAEIVHVAGGLLHVDAVQGPGRMACDFKALGADLLTLSAHKFGGPQGAGALIRRSDLALEPLIKGGGQEHGTRAGTENVAAIAGFGAAAEAAGKALTDEVVRMTALRDQLEVCIRAVASDAVIFGAQSARLPQTTLFSVPGMKAETAVIAFDLEGVAVSSGSACSSGKVAPSHVLAAMGVDMELAKGAIRVSLGYSTGLEEVESFQKAWARLAESLYKARKQRDIAA